MIDADRRLQELGSRGWTLLAATAFGGAALLVSVAIATSFLRMSIPELWTTSAGLYSPGLIVGATLGGLVLGGLTWRLFVETSPGKRPVRGAVSGLLTGVGAHIVMWAVHSVWGTASGDPLVASFTLWFYLPYSLLFFGTITGAAGAGVGIGLAYARRSIGTDRRSVRPGRTAELGPGSTRRWALVAATAFGLSGALLAGLLHVILPGPNVDLPTIVFFTGAGAAIGAVFWWGFVERARTVTVRRGTAVGAAIAVLTPFGMGLLWMLWEGISTLAGWTQEPSVSMASLEVVEFVVFVGFFVLVPLGFLSVPVGAVIGYALARWRRQNSNRSGPITE